MSPDEALDSEADFKPNLVNSVCYLVEQVGALIQILLLPPAWQCQICLGGLNSLLPHHPLSDESLPCAQPSPPQPPPLHNQPQTVQLTTFAVNYVGHPFNESLADNKGMSNSLRMSSMFLLVVVLEAVPQLNERWVPRWCVCVCAC